MHEYSEDMLVEQPAMDLFRRLGWETVNCYDEVLGLNGTLGRETRSDVVLVRRLRAALERLNPGISRDVLDQVVEELIRDRSSQSLVHANRDIYHYLKQGIKVSIRNDDGEEERTETIQVIDWNHPEHNDFFLASQLWITGEIYTRRPDLIGFVNGIPLVLIELKAAHRRLKHAFDDNLRDYKNTIPQLFWYNAFVILSNGSQSRIGSLLAGNTSLSGRRLPARVSRVSYLWRR